MSCRDENRKINQDYERVQKLAKAASKMNNKVYLIYKKDDSTFAFEPWEELQGTGFKKEAMEFVWYY